MEGSLDPAAVTRLSAVADLGAAARSLVQAVVETDTDGDTLLRAAALAREATALLRRAVRPANRLAAADGVGIRERIYSPVAGEANPLAPPLRILTLDADQCLVEAECTLHRGYEGPPTYGHGGVSALLMDQVLGTAVALGGRSGLTRSLETVYRRPVPLAEPLRLTGRISRRSGNRTDASGEIVTAARPDVVLVSATATFVMPTPEQVTRLFGHVDSSGARIPTGD
ncbi:MAG TPA: PaaI family thioesterase [Kineosporiaceae bacterium]